jgi:hypothetical protein
MALYQLYFLNDSDRDVERQDHRCADDDAALQIGRSLCFDRNIDVWSGGRRVARIGKDKFAHLSAAQMLALSPSAT